MSHLSVRPGEQQGTASPDDLCSPDCSYRAINGFCPVEFSKARSDHAATASLGLVQVLTNVWHATFTALPIFITSFAWQAYLYCEEYVYIHTSV